MIRELFHIGPLSISPFGVLLVAAFLAAYFQLAWGLKRLRAGDEEDASSILFAAGVGGIAGAKIYYALLYRDWHLLWDRSGLVWYGGFIVGAAAVLWVMRRRRLATWPLLDAATPALALGYGIGRIGCFLVGDDYGIPTSLPWGVKFPQGLPPTEARYLRGDFGVELPAGTPDHALLAVHPTQLYETFLALCIWGLGIWMLRRGKRGGTVALTTFALLAVERLAIEFLRAKDDRLFGDFTLAQAISLAVLVGVALLWARRPAETSGAAARS